MFSNWLMMSKPLWQRFIVRIFWLHKSLWADITGELLCWQIMIGEAILFCCLSRRKLGGGAEANINAAGCNFNSFIRRAVRFVGRLIFFKLHTYSCCIKAVHGSWLRIWVTLRWHFSPYESSKWEFYKTPQFIHIHGVFLFYTIMCFITILLTLSVHWERIGFCFLPKGTWACRLKQRGIKPSNFWLADLLYPLWATATSNLLTVKLLLSEWIHAFCFALLTLDVTCCIKTDSVSKVNAFIHSDKPKSYNSNITSNTQR